MLAYMRLRGRFPILGLIGLLLLLGCESRQTDTKAVEQRLETAIPLQSSPGQVLNYLEDQRIEHSQYQRDALSGNSIKAAIRGKSKWEIVRTDYGIDFWFDKHDRLSSIDVRPKYTGP
jgi:hypothetical protein